jgi:hypothetical protein
MIESIVFEYYLLVQGIIGQITNTLQTVFNKEWISALQSV